MLMRLVLAGDSVGIVIGAALRLSTPLGIPPLGVMPIIFLLCVCALGEGILIV